MDSKLTLKLDKDVIDKAKRLAERRGTSLSRMVESYFSGLAEAEQPIQKELTGVVAELAGILSGTQIGNPEDEYTDYLVRKYS
jgi:hypothetical protein